MLRGILHALLIPLVLAFPSPFDSSLSYNLTASCVNFLANVVVSPQLGGTGVIGEPFIDNGTDPSICRPFSLLLGTSSEWSQLARNTTSLNVAVTDVCASTSCSSYMKQMAAQIQQKANCGLDLQQGKAVAKQALQGAAPKPLVDIVANLFLGFTSYDLMQRVGCLKDPTTGAWCYVQAATSADDGYLYSLPGGS